MERTWYAFMVGPMIEGKMQNPYAPGSSVRPENWVRISHTVISPDTRILNRQSDRKWHPPDKYPVNGAAKILNHTIFPHCIPSILNKRSVSYLYLAERQNRWPFLRASPFCIPHMFCTCASRHIFMNFCCHLFLEKSVF